MAPLAILLIVKILATLALVAVPFLLLPRAKLERLSGFDSAPVPLLRLYGVAILALLVGYVGGLVAVLNGVFPWGVVAMGVVSNLGAALVMVVTGYARKKMFSALFFFLIGGGLVIAAMAPEWALTRI